MSSHRTTFNHVGLCVSDRERSRRFYEGLLGFQFWWELDPPDGPTAKLVQLPEPLGVHATYLVRDGFVLELMDYSKRQVHTGSERVMDQIGLTHISFSVSDLERRVGEGRGVRGSGGRGDGDGGDGDDPRSGWAVAGIAFGWVVVGAAASALGRVRSVWLGRALRIGGGALTKDS